MGSVWTAAVPGNYSSGGKAAWKDGEPVGVGAARRDRGPDSGQSLVEYVLILATIVVVSLATVIVLSHGINGLFGKDSNLPNGFNPPAAPGPVTPPGPTSVAQCLHGGWRSYPQFSDRTACIEFVTGGG
jgi:Flp pilus assembly pilin Flp